MYKESIARYEWPNGSYWMERRSSAIATDPRGVVSKALASAVNIVIGIWMGARAMWL